LVIRDVTFQNPPKPGVSSFPRSITAEQTITDQAVGVPGEEGVIRSTLRKNTLSFLNGLYREVSGLF
ncbi:MAG: hypothetical protein GXZ19_06860, partial [Bacteroidales bacterium]|nr:hypothetical protein [Bacteroidales bacterium]